MLRGLPVGNPVLDKHVAGKIPLRLEGAARRAADCGPLPWLRDLAVGDVAQVSKNLALVTESAHASMLRHLPLGGEQLAAVGTVMLQKRNTSSQPRRHKSHFSTKHTSLIYNVFTIH